MLVCKKNELPIKTAFCDYENIHDDELYRYFLNKENTEFWKCLCAKFLQNSAADIYLNGFNNDFSADNKCYASVQKLLIDT